MGSEHVELMKCACCYQFPVVEHAKARNGEDFWSVYCGFVMCDNRLDACAKDRNEAARIWNHQQERTINGRNK